MWMWPSAVLLAIAAPAIVAPSPEQRLLAELNRARSDPAGYATTLREYRNYYRGTLVAVPGAPVLYETQEGVAPVDEAIAFLQSRAEGAPGLTPAGLLADAAGDHRAEQGRDGTIGHVGSDGSQAGERVLRRGGGAYVGEVIAYGSDSPADMVRQLIVDDGVADRSHRKLLFDGSLRFAGVSCGPHPVYRTMCVIDLARTPDGRSQTARFDPDGRRKLAQLNRRVPA